MNRFFVIINDAKKGSWSDLIWKDIEEEAQIFLRNNIIKSDFFKKLKKIHFGNKLNRKIWIPFKSIWNSKLILKKDDLREVDRNYIIFQSNIKFSPSYIKRLKKEKNACIILYLPDTISGIGIGNTIDDFKRYCNYYKIDYVFSFDKEDCKKYNLKFFDIYSVQTVDNKANNENQSIFYIGNCRNDERRKKLIKVYEKIYKAVQCNFNLVGVKEEKKLYSNEIKYNHSLPYYDVIKKIQSNNCILELINDNQSGNTLRFKEAICYNKKLLTNNYYVLNSSYYNSEWIQYFKNVEEIDIEWIKKKVNINYNYNGEFSPKELLKQIVYFDKEGEKNV